MRVRRGGNANEPAEGTPLGVVVGDTEEADDATTAAATAAATTRTDHLRMGVSTQFEVCKEGRGRISRYQRREAQDLDSSHQRILRCKSVETSSRDLARADAEPVDIDPPSFGPMSADSSIISRRSK